MLCGNPSESDSCDALYIHRFVWAKKEDIKILDVESDREMTLDEFNAEVKPSD